MISTNGFPIETSCVGTIDINTCIKVRSSFGYCPNYCEKVPKYIPLPQWGNWICEYKSKIHRKIRKEMESENVKEKQTD